MMAAGLVFFCCIKPSYCLIGAGEIYKSCQIKEFAWFILPYVLHLDRMYLFIFAPLHYKVITAAYRIKSSLYVKANYSQINTVPHIHLYFQLLSGSPLVRDTTSLASKHVAFPTNKQTSQTFQADQRHVEVRNSWLPVMSLY